MRRGDRGCPAASGESGDRDVGIREYFYVAEEKAGEGTGKQMWEHMNVTGAEK